VLTGVVTATGTATASESGCSGLVAGALVAMTCMVPRSARGRVARLHGARRRWVGSAVGWTYLTVPSPVFRVARSLRARAGRRARAAAATVAVAELAGALAAEVQAGASLRVAFPRCLGESDDAPLRALLAPVAAVIAMGGDPVPGLASAATQPGCSALGLLAGSWGVAEAQGTASRGLLDRVADAARAESAQRLEVRSQLAGPLASARLLAAMPAVGLVMGTGLGASPASVLLGSPVGLALAGLGIGLVTAGLAWLSRLAAAAEGAA
jgi:tight adherence protein B